MLIAKSSEKESCLSLTEFELLEIGFDAEKLLKDEISAAIDFPCVCTIDDYCKLLKKF